MQNLLIGYFFNLVQELALQILWNDYVENCRFWKDTKLKIDKIMVATWLLCQDSLSGRMKTLKISWLISCF